MRSNVYKVTARFTKDLIDERIIHAGTDAITFVIAPNVQQALANSSSMDGNEIVSCELVIASIGEWR